MRLSLGTVQFGLSYGIANRHGQVSVGEGAEILRAARGAGIDTLDTAIAYGDSEERLGELGVREWHVITKLPPIGTMPEGVAGGIGGWVRQVVSRSLARLKVPRLRALLLHRPADLLEPGGEELYATMVAIKTEGLAERIGISIYDPEELEVFSDRFSLELVQAPFNVLDRRLETSGWLQRLRERGVEVHTRSAFLQGLLLMDEADRPEYFLRWRPKWQRWHEWLRVEGISPLQACIGFALSRPAIDRVVVGADTAAQLRQTIEAARARPASVPDELQCDDRDLLNPSRWPKS